MAVSQDRGRLVREVRTILGEVQPDAVVVDTPGVVTEDSEGLTAFDAEERRSTADLRIRLLDVLRASGWRVGEAGTDGVLAASKQGVGAGYFVVEWPAVAFQGLGQRE